MDGFGVAANPLLSGMIGLMALPSQAENRPPEGAGTYRVIFSFAIAQLPHESLKTLLQIFICMLSVVLSCAASEIYPIDCSCSML
jgi:hypothetical protein